MRTRPTDRQTHRPRYTPFVVGTTWHLTTWRETSSGPLTQTLASVHVRRLVSDW